PILKSTDGGKTWSALNTGLAFDLNIKTLTVDPKNTSIVYASADSGIFKSADGGNNWQPLIKRQFSPSSFSLSIDPLTSSTLYVGTLSGVLKSTDGGMSLNPTSLTAPITEVAVSSANPSTVYAGQVSFPPPASRGDSSVVPQATGDFFKSTDAGSSWASM